MDLEKELKDLEMEFTNLEIFPTQRSNPGLPHCRWLLYQLSHREAREEEESSQM